MTFTPMTAKGLSACWVDRGLDPSKLTVHISEIAAGTRAHPPHIHVGVEAFYVLEGNGVVEIEDERQALGANECIMIDPTRLHGLVNTGSSAMRYMVIIARS